MKGFNSAKAQLTKSVNFKYGLFSNFSIIILWRYIFLGPEAQNNRISMALHYCGSCHNRKTKTKTHNTNKIIHRRQRFFVENKNQQPQTFLLYFFSSRKKKLK